MAFFDCHFFSDALGQSVSVSVLLPQKTACQIGMASLARSGRFPTLYLLHGLSDDHTIWMRRSAIERHVAALNLAVVMPAVARSFYQNMASGPRYWTFVSEELPAVMRSFFPLSEAREDTFAAGLSMGGYGALRLALARPQSYAAAASFSGALDVVRRCSEAGREGSLFTRTELEGVFGRELAVEGTDSDLAFLAQRIVTGGGLVPKLFLSCGTEDPILRESRAFRQHLASVGLDCTYEESPGAHEWSFWDAQIQRALAWLPLRQ